VHADVKIFLTRNATKHSFPCCAVKICPLVNDCDLVAGFSDFYLPLCYLTPSVPSSYWVERVLLIPSLTFDGAIGLWSVLELDTVSVPWNSLSDSLHKMSSFSNFKKHLLSRLFRNLLVQHDSFDVKCSWDSSCCWHRSLLTSAVLLFTCFRGRFWQGPFNVVCSSAGRYFHVILVLRYRFLMIPIRYHRVTILFGILISWSITILLLVAFNLCIYAEGAVIVKVDIQGSEISTTWGSTVLTLPVVHSAI